MVQIESNRFGMVEVKTSFAPKSFVDYHVFEIRVCIKIPSWNVFNWKRKKHTHNKTANNDEYAPHFWYFANWKFIFRLRDYYFLHFTSKRYQFQTKTSYKIIMNKYALCWAGALNYFKHPQANDNNWEKRNEGEKRPTNRLNNILNSQLHAKETNGTLDIHRLHNPQSTPFIVLILSNSRRQKKKI